MDNDETGINTHSAHAANQTDEDSMELNESSNAAANRPVNHDERSSAEASANHPGMPSDETTVASSTVIIDTNYAASSAEDTFHSAASSPASTTERRNTGSASSLGQILAAMTGGNVRIISTPVELGVRLATSQQQRRRPLRLAASYEHNGRSVEYVPDDDDESSETPAQRPAAPAAARRARVQIGRVAQLRARLAEFFNSDDDDDDSDDGNDNDYIPLRTATRRTRLDSDDTTSQQPPTGSSLRAGKRAKDSATMLIDITKIKASDFQLRLDARFGRLRPRRRRPLMSAACPVLQTRTGLPTLLTERECRSLTTTEKLQLSCQLLPDTKMRLAHLQHGRFFGGIYSADGDLFVSYSQDQYIRLFDTSRTTAQAHMIRSIRARDVGWSIIDVQVSPDGSHLVYSSWSDSIHMCPLRDIRYNAHDAENRELSGNSRLIRQGSSNGGGNNDDPQEVQKILPLNPTYYHSFCVFSMNYSYNAREIIAGASAGYIYVYDLMSDRRTLCIGGHTEDCNAVAFSRTSSDVFFSTGDDGLIKIWDRRALDEAHPTAVGVFAGHQNGCTFLDAHFDGRHVLSNSKDQTIKLWDCRKTASPEAIVETSRAVRSQSWDYRQQQYVREAGARITAAAHPLKHDCSLMTYAGAHTLLTTLIRARFSPQHITGGRYVYCGSADNDVVIYDALTAKPVKLLMHHTELVRDVHWHPYRQEIVSSGWDGDHELWFHRPTRAGAADKFKYADTLHRDNVIVSVDVDDDDESGSSQYYSAGRSSLMTQREGDDGRIPTVTVHKANKQEAARRTKRKRLEELGLLDPL